MAASDNVLALTYQWRALVIVEGFYYKFETRMYPFAVVKTAGRP
jgi:hypothetical protein